MHGDEEKKKHIKIQREMSNFWEDQKFYSDFYLFVNISLHLNQRLTK